MSDKYYDYNGNEIKNGDILRLRNYERQNEYAPKEPFLIFIENEDGNNELYISGMDEYQPISDWQSDEDKKENKISAIEIFAEKSVINANFTQKQPHDVCLTFAEIEHLYKMVKEYIKNDDYGFAPVMHIVLTPDKDFIEYQTVKTCCIHDITKAIMQAKESGKQLVNPHIDITDVDKADFI